MRDERLETSSSSSYYMYMNLRDDTEILIVCDLF